MKTIPLIYVHSGKDWKVYLIHEIVDMCNEYVSSINSVPTKVKFYQYDDDYNDIATFYKTNVLKKKTYFKMKEIYVGDFPTTIPEWRDVGIKEKMKEKDKHG